MDETKLWADTWFFSDQPKTAFVHNFENEKNQAD